jgi:hypothetical protein
MIKLEKQTILVISNEPWGEMWFSKHNWANELSQKNIVYFINSPKKWTLRNLFSSNVDISKYSNSLNIITYNNTLPFTRFGIIFKWNESIVVKSITKKLKKDSGFIFWSFDPYRFSSPQLFKPLKSIFFRVDIFLFKKRERRLINNVDGVVVSAKELLKGVNAKKELVISHGISKAEFVCENEIEYESGFILYVGKIDHRLDLILIKKMLLEFPGEQFLFIGTIANLNNDLFQELFFQEKYNNLIIHGVEHFKNLKNYVKKSKACLAPMDLSVHGNAVHHHKSLQYLAMGKPVISPIFNDTINNDEFILGYKNEEEAIDIIKNINISETPEKIEKRINFAKQFLYTNLITKVEDFLSDK